MKTVKFKNLTPHAIVLRDGNGTDVTIPPSGSVARVDQVPGDGAGMLNGIPVYTAPKAGAVSGIPAPSPGTYYIVSGLVLAHTSRPDVVAPGTGPNDGAIRNDKGHIVAVTRLIKAVP